MDGLNRKRAAGEGLLPPPPAGMEKLSAPRLGLGLLYDLSCALNENPHVLYLGGESAVTAYYRGACYACADFLQDYGGAVAVLSEHWPVTVCGTVEGAEVGELRVSRTARGVHYEKCGVSGREFRTLSDLCVQIDAGARDSRAALAEAVGRMRWRNGCVAVRRRSAPFWRRAGLEEPAEGGHFLYLPLAGEAGPDECLECLSLEDKAELWEEYLGDGVSALEFEWLMDAFTQRRARGLLEWELALRLVLPRLGVTVTNTSGRFRITGARGSPLRLSYESAPAAGKLFLKLLFPA